MVEIDNHAISIPCPICGMGETGTHNHYGGRACTSCRAFFRRSVQTNSFKVKISIGEYYVSDVVYDGQFDQLIYYFIKTSLFVSEFQMPKCKLKK